MPSSCTSDFVEDHADRSKTSHGLSSRVASKYTSMEAIVDVQVPQIPEQIVDHVRPRLDVGEPFLDLYEVWTCVDTCCSFFSASLFHILHTAMFIHTGPLSA